MIEITTQAILLVSLFYGSPVTALAASANAPRVSDTSSSQHEQVIVLPQTLESHVREYFKDTPILAEVARCESTFRHVLSNGKVVRGKVNPDDVGVMQINEMYHEEKAEKLGFDLESLDGNLAYAKWLYERQGLKPWSASSKCWKTPPMQNDSVVARK